MLNGEYFPWEDVVASRGDKRSYEHHSAEQAKEKYLKKARPCPRCKTTPDQLSWIYLLSPEWTWQILCGKAGWITVCDRCNLQVDFFPEIMNWI